MSEQTAFQKVLFEKLMDIRLRRPNFSLRAFALKIGISAPELSEILRGKRKASARIIERVSQRLPLSPEESEALLETVRQDKTDSNLAAQNQRPSLQLNMDHFKAISDWFHFAILSLAETEDFSDNPAWIARRLNISLTQTKEALARLERLGMLERTEGGALKATGVQYATSDEIANVSLRNSHSKDLELAQKSLEQDEIEDRDFTAMTLAIDPKKLPMAKKMIREFRDRLGTFLESESKTEVYKICMQLFPLTKLEKNYDT
jgi:uncharacterized protein (TIGR02147 family)